MAPREKSSLKRGLVNANADADSQDQKKPRRSQRISSQTQLETPIDHEYLPTPLTTGRSAATDIRNEVTATPPDSPNHARSSPLRELSPEACSPSADATQAMSQFVYPPRVFADEVENENAEGVWGYLMPLDDKVDSPFVLKKREGCAADNSSKQKSGKQAPSGYLVGRHPECDLIIESPTISNRHLLIFDEKKRGDVVAILEDLSSNGTFVNDALVGRNKHRELEDGDEVSILNEARFVFRYPRTRDTNRFHQQYQINRQLGKGHFASVYLCMERATGNKFAAKVFEKRPGESQRSLSQTDTLQKEIAILKAVEHVNLLCLKDVFDENDGAYLVLELAPQGELFNYIVTNQRLTEKESRHVFQQLFEGLRYLHDRGIVHRDIKPENILLADESLKIKLGDFGLAKIIGEDSFTTTLCGTPSYVAPEILEESSKRQYTKAVDIWSLGVVLYVCLCGFPPFSDELCTRQYPYRLAQQIKLGKFDYPSPHWDSVQDWALDLIDRMLCVDPVKRYTVEQCLEHPWITENYPKVTDSTDGLTGALGNLDFSKRKMERERTLLSSINEVTVTAHDEEDNKKPKALSQATDKRVHNQPAKTEPSPGGSGAPDDFINLGEGGNAPLY